MNENEQDMRKSLRWYITVGIGKDRKEPNPENSELTGWIPMVGDQKTFTPHAFTDYIGRENSVFRGLDLKVTGEVVYVSTRRRWYRVRYDLGGKNGVGYECFKF